MKIKNLCLIMVLLITPGAVAYETDNAPAPEACNQVQSYGAPDRCAHCGCRACCEKYCRVVCEMKEIKKTVWVVKCEDFCAPLPRCGRCCESCGQECCKQSSCENCGGKSCNPCASLENRNYVPPQCGKVRTKKTLEKKEIVCKIPTYKCVVVYACANCAQKACGSEKGAPESAPAPAAPLPAPVPKTTQNALHQPIVGTSFLR
jgi:hypothetical protein